MAASSTYNEQAKTIWLHTPGVTLVTLAVKLPHRSPTRQLTVGWWRRVLLGPMVPSKPAYLSVLFAPPGSTSYPSFSKYTFFISISISIISHDFPTIPVSVSAGKRGQQLRKNKKKVGLPGLPWKNGENARSPKMGDIGPLTVFHLDLCTCPKSWARRGGGGTWELTTVLTIIGE